MSSDFHLTLLWMRSQAVQTAADMMTNGQRMKRWRYRNVDSIIEINSSHVCPADFEKASSRSRFPSRRGSKYSEARVVQSSHEEPEHKKGKKSRVWRSREKMGTDERRLNKKKEDVDRKELNSLIIQVGADAGDWHKRSRLPKKRIEKKRILSISDVYTYMYSYLPLISFLYHIIPGLGVCITHRLPSVWPTTFVIFFCPPTLF